MKQLLNQVLDEVSSVIRRIDEREAVAVARMLQEARRIFVYGEGRSGLMGRAFAMRLMHGGATVYVIGETITPSIGEGDLLVAVSGSGASSALQGYCRKAKGIGANVVLVTTNAAGEVAALCDQTLLIPAATKHRRPGEPPTIQPLGNQFDQSVHLVLDAIVIHGFANADSGETNRRMAARHANLE